MRISILKKIARAIKNQINHKERFLRACVYSFYVQSKRIELENGIGFLPFMNEQHARDYGKSKADELMNLWKKEGTIDIRYKHALAWVKAQG